MTSPLQIHRDSEGRLRAKWPSGEAHAEWLSQFLEGDVADDRSYAERVLAAGRAVLVDSHPWKTSGNAFALHLHAHGAEIHPLHLKEADSLHIPLKEFLGFVEQWHQSILHH